MNDDFILRKLLWLRHGCPISHLYGDDGEMQCNHCLIDFKRDHIRKIEYALTRRSTGNFASSALMAGLNVGRQNSGKL